jgi:ATP-dependent Zn protease
MHARKEILEYYLQKHLKVAPEVNALALAKQTPGFTGADISNLVNTAAIKTAHRNKARITMQELEEAKDDILMGSEMKRQETPESRRLTAYHEGGHALVSLFTPGSDPIHKATIIWRGTSLGVTAFSPDKDRTSRTRRELEAWLVVSMGGRAAEELIFGEEEVTTGASSDFQQANRIAYQMVTQYGMSPKVGFLTVDKKTAGALSDDQKNAIDEAVKEILNHSYNKAKMILKEHEGELHKIAKALLEYETLSGEELKSIVDGKKVERKLA